MTTATAYAVLMIVFGTMAIASFLIQGRQWPTAITAAIFGIFLGATSAGEAVAAALADFLQNIVGSLQ
jgi:hypothetical protein